MDAASLDLWATPNCWILSVCCRTGWPFRRALERQEWANRHWATDTLHWGVKPCTGTGSAQLGTSSPEGGRVLVSRKVKLGTAAWAANQLCTGAAACAPAQDDPGFLLHSTCSSASGFCVQLCALQLTKDLTILSVFREESTRWSGTEYFLGGQAEGTGIVQRTEDLGRILQGPSWGDGARLSLWYTAEEQEKMVRLTWGRFWLEINNQNWTTNEALRSCRIFVLGGFQSPTWQSFKHHGLKSVRSCLKQEAGSPKVHFSLNNFIIHGYLEAQELQFPSYIPRSIRYWTVW